MTRLEILAGLHFGLEPVLARLDGVALRLACIPPSPDGVLAGLDDVPPMSDGVPPMSDGVSGMLDGVSLGLDRMPARLDRVPAGLDPVPTDAARFSSVLA
jgi:hypothetical protein